MTISSEMYELEWLQKWTPLRVLNPYEQIQE